MAKNVVVVVSGETDRRSIPHLCGKIRQQTQLFDVRKPPGNATLSPEQATRLIRSAWYDLRGRGSPPQKFVVLVDTDGHDPSSVTEPFEVALASLKDIPTPKLVATATRHLEAWFFGHAEELREFLKRDLGSVDTSRPDEIDDPKRHLINLLKSGSRVYTAPVAEQIATRLDQLTIEGRSRSFADFVGKLKNGEAS